MGEHTTADDEVLGTVEFEQEQIAGRQGLEAFGTTGLPEVHLFQLGLLTQQAVPVGIGHCHETLHQQPPTSSIYARIFIQPGRGPFYPSGKKRTIPSPCGSADPPPPRPP